MKIPGYDIIQKLGDGSAGIVWKGHQVSLDRIVAIKILRDELLSDPEEVSDFIKEARSAAQLKHPNLVQVYDVANQNGKYYFVMEYIDGPTVTKLIEGQGVIPQKLALKIILQVADALKSAWDQNRLIHRDIKPDNIVIDKDGTTKLADLGLAKQVGRKRPNSKATDTIAGTPNYMSPEQASGSPNLDITSDMYSLGATLYHMITGKIPFDGCENTEILQKHITDFLPNPRTINPSISVATARLISLLMMKSSSDRYPSWDAVMTDIKKATSGQMFKTSAGNDCVSTIRPPKGSGNSIRTGGVATARSATKAPVQEQKLPIPMTIKVLAWTLIGVLWLSIAYIFINKTDVISSHITGTQQNLPPPKPIEMTNIPDPVEGEDENVDQSTAVYTTTEDIPTTEEPAQPVAPKIDPLIDLKIALADMLITKNFAGVAELLNQKKKDAKGTPIESDMNKLSNFIKESSDIDNTVRAAFMKNIGKEIILNHNNKRYNLVLRAISGDTINAILTIGTNAKVKPVKFHLSELNPAEQARWIKASSPTRYTMKYILNMEATNYTAASECAPNCGPFSEVFIKKVKEKMPKDTEEDEEAGT